MLEETRYRLACAIAAAAASAGAGAADREPAYLSARGFEKLAAEGRAIFRHLWGVRELEAERLDVPAGRLFATDALLAVARARPATGPEDLAKLRLPRDLTRELAPAILDAVARGSTTATSLRNRPRPHRSPAPAARGDHSRRAREGPR